MKRLLLVMALLLVAPASAQLPSAAFEMTAEPVEFLTPDAVTELAVNVTVGCMEVLENLGEADVMLGLLEPPSWATFEAVEVHFGIEECIGVPELTKSAVLPVTIFEAPGLIPTTLTLQAVLGSHTTEATLPDVMVDYVPGHTMDPDGDQTFMVDGPTYEFDLTVDITANAKTMVMFEDKVVSGATSLTGLKAKIFDVAGGERQLVAPITFTAPTGAWTEETVTFYNYSHCLDKEGCGEEFAQEITWTFVNANPGAAMEQPAESESTPFAGLVVIGLALVAVAARRR